MTTSAAGIPSMALVLEGKTKIFVPAESLQSKVATKREPVFFNPAAEFNRDISIIAYSSFLSKPDVRFCGDKSNRRKYGRNEVVMADALCGSGARGLRVAVEAIGIDKIYFNDVNPLAVELAKKSSTINQIGNRCFFSVSDVCKFLLNGTVQKKDPSTNTQYPVNKKENSGERFTIVDLDPFGSPANYIDCVMRSVENGGLVSITATDTAVLCGKYPDVCLRKYYGMPLSNSYSNEIALRLLISLLALTSSRLGISIRPLFSHTNMHYIRTYVQATLSSKMANSVFDNIGYIQHCFQCGNRTASSLDNKAVACELCSASLKTAGWLWTGKIYDKDFVKEMMARIYLLNEWISDRVNSNLQEDIKVSTRQDSNSEKTRENSRSQDWKQSLRGESKSKKLRVIQRLLSKCTKEYDDIPFYFTSDEISSKLKMGPPSLETIVNNLSKAGFRTSLTGLNPTGFKTVAKVNEVMLLLKR
jgi:tRNA (guanine26-N2/guanine27-N2)-dimethyltransferase